MFITAVLLATGHADALENDPMVMLETDHGAILIQLFMDDCPVTAGNFLNLSGDGFYDGLTFHRVVEGFMVQGGDPDGDGTGGPGYTIPDEPSALANHHFYGAVSMANSGPGTAGSQFFIVVSENGSYHLDGMHAVFGQVFEGFDNLTSISEVPTDANGAPLEPVVIRRVVRLDAEAPDPVPPEDMTVEVGKRITLDGSLSTDDIGIVNWTWYIHDGNATTVLHGPVVEYRFTEEGRHSVALVLFDAAGNNAGTTFYVTVVPREEVPPDPELWPVAVVLVSAAVAIVAVVAYFRLRREGDGGQGPRHP